jgi:hypothetical protein
MSVVIPSWLLYVAGGIGCVLALWILVWIVLFAILGRSFYKAFKNWSWPG